MVLPLRDQNPTRRFPIITVVLIALNVLVYFAVQPHDTAAHENRFLYDHAAIPCELVHGHELRQPQLALSRCDAPNRAVDVELQGQLVHVPNAPVAPGKNIYLAVIVSMFLHANLLHLFGNMLFLWIFGNNVEDHLGRIGYTLFYFAAGIVAAVAFSVFNASSIDVVIGASGAIAGVMGAYLVWFPRARILSVIFPIVFLPFVIPAYVVLLLWFVMQFFTNPNTGVAWVAHVGGFTFGALLAYLLRGTHGPSTRHVPEPPPLPGAWPGGFRSS